MHRLGDVGRREVDDDRLGPGRRRQAERSSVSSSPSAEATQASFRRRLRNPGPATSGGPAIGARSTACGQLGGQVAGLAPERLGQRHAAVGLIVAELGIGRRAHGLFKSGPVAPLGYGRAEDRPQCSSTFMIPIQDCQISIPASLTADGAESVDRDYRRQSGRWLTISGRASAGSCQSSCGASPQISSSA